MNFAGIDNRERQAHNLCDWECQPHVGDLAQARQQERCRKQHHQLSNNGYIHAVNAFSQSLKYTALHYSIAGQWKTNRNNSKRRDADGQHFIRGIENSQEDVRNHPEQKHSHRHNHHRVPGTEAGCFQQAVLLPRAVVIADDGDHAVVQTEDGHKHKAVELEVDAEGCGGGLPGGVIGDEDLVHEERHHRADGDHNDAGQADGVDLADEPEVGAEALDGQGDVGILLVVEVYGQGAAAELADDGGHGGAGNAHVQGKDEDGVQNDVDDGAQTLGVHTEDRPPGALEQPFVHDLAEHTQRADGHHPQVVVAHADDVLDLRLGTEEQVGAGGTQKGGDDEAHQRQQYAVVGDLVGAFTLSGTQCPAHQGVDAYGGAGGQTDHQVLGGEGQRNGGERLLADAADEHAVHDVVQRLHQHGRDDGQGHIPDQLRNGHDAQLVFVFHRDSFIDNLNTTQYFIMSRQKKKPPNMCETHISGGENL